MAKSTTAATYEEARRRARYGHKEWLLYIDRSGNHVYTMLSKASIKQAMLAMGTNGRCEMITASSACGLSVDWRCGVNILREYRKGWRH